MKQIRVALSATTHNKAAKRKPSASSLEGKLEAHLKQHKWLSILTSQRQGWTGRLELGTSETDKILRCVSGVKELPRALQQTGAFGLEVLKLLADPKARGEALALLVAEWNRLQTDGPFATVLALVRAAFWAFSEKSDLSGDVSDQSFNVRILAALVRNGLYQQNADFSLCYGPKLLAFEGTPPGGADLVTCSRDAVLLSAQNS